LTAGSSRPRPERDLETVIPPDVPTRTSQEVGPWNERFARENRVPEFATRDVVASNDARTIANTLPTMNQEQFSAAFKARQ
jgi:hypothetical protein